MVEIGRFQNPNIARHLAENWFVACTPGSINEWVLVYALFFLGPRTLFDLGHNGEIHFLSIEKLIFFRHFSCKCCFKGSFKSKAVAFLILKLTCRPITSSCVVVNDSDERSMHLFIEFRLLGHVALKSLNVQPKILVSGLYPRRMLPCGTFLPCASFQLLGVSLYTCSVRPSGVWPVL